MTAGPFIWPPQGLFRDPEQGKIAGVCAGLAAYFQVKPKFLRLGMILLSVFGFFIPMVVLYGVLTVLLPPRRTTEPAAAAQGGAWRDPSFERRVVGLRDGFHRMDQRLARIEAAVTSEEFFLRQKFRDL